MFMRICPNNTQTIILKHVKNHGNFIENLSQMSPNSLKNLLNSILGSFWDVFGTISRPGRLADGFRKLPGYHFWRQGGLKRCPMGPFLGPPWIQNGSKIAPSRIGWHLDPLKMVSGRGFGKNMKNQ